MKKRIIIYITFFLFIQNVFSIEIRTNKIIGGYKKQSFGIYSINSIFYNSNDNLIIKGNYFGTDRFFCITENTVISEIDEIIYTEYAKKYLLFNSMLKYNYKVNISKELIAFENSSEPYFDSRNKEQIEPLYFYINNSNDQIVFNFNKWKINHEEYFPISTYNSLSEEIFYTDEDRERIMKINTAYTVKNLYCVNNKKNQIAIVLDNYNSEGLSALIIFDVLYNATINDFKVRLRKEPNLDCETLSYFYEGNKVKIVDQSDEPYEIDGENWYWYKVESGSYPVGWVYGKYLDIEK